MFDSAKPSMILESRTITGLSPTDHIVAVDFETFGNDLYAVTSGANNAGKVYTINIDTGAASQQGGTFPGIPLDPALTFDIDFDAVTLDFHLVSSGGLNMRFDFNGGVIDANPNAGGVQTDDTLHYLAGSSHAGTTPKIAGIAYTNSFPNTPSSVLTAIDLDLAQLDTLQTPNNGALTTNGGPLKVKPTAIHGFDILNGTFLGLAGFTVGGVDKLYSISLNTGAAKLLGAVGDGTVHLVSLAALPSGLGIVGKTATFRDYDGDDVTVTTTKGTFTRGQFVMNGNSNATGGQGVAKVTFTEAAGFSGAAITFTAKPSTYGGDGEVDVYEIDASGVNLAGLTIAGDLNILTAGTVGNTGVAIGKLSLRSYGALHPGILDPRETAMIITGGVSSLVIPGPTLGAMTITGALGTASLGILNTPLSVGSVTGLLKIGTMVDSVLSIAGDAKAISIGALTGSGYVGNSIVVGGAVGSLSVKGDVLRSSILIRGHTNPTTDAAAMALGSLTIGGNVEYGSFLVGFDNMAMPVNGNVRVGKVTGGGNWHDVTLSVGIDRGDDDDIGTEDDHRITGAHTTSAKLSSIAIKGNFTADFRVAITAGEIGSATVGGHKIVLRPSPSRVNNIFTFGTGYGVVQEVGG